MYMPWYIGHMDANPAVLDVILRKIGSGFAGDILRILASYKGCLESFWQSINHALETSHIQYAAFQLRHSLEIGHLHCSSHLLNLEDRYSREQIRQIKYVFEVFYTFEPVYAILAALAQRWIDGKRSGNTPAAGRIKYWPDINMPICPGKIDFADVNDNSGTQHLLYKALSKWPEYAAMVRKEIDNSRDAAERIRFAMYEAHALSADINIMPSDCFLPIDDVELEKSIHTCGQESACAIVTAIMLRKGLIMHEESEREKRQ